MIQIREFIMSGGDATDDADLVRMISGRMPATAPAKLAWLQQVELMLDGYGGDAQLKAVARVKTAIKAIRLEIDSAAS